MGRVKLTRHSRNLSMCNTSDESLGGSSLARVVPGQLHIEPLFETVDLGDESGLPGLELVNIPLLIAFCGRKSAASHES